MKATKENIIQFLYDIKSNNGNHGIIPIGLFGSFARGDESIYSDIDIAIQKTDYFFRSSSPYEYFNEVNHLKELVFKTFHRNSDVFDIDSTSSIKETILKELVHV